jgi:nucleoside-diphosphate-sugar epimerase
MTETIVLSGGSGFLGTHLRQALEANGFYVFNVPNNEETRIALSEPGHAHLFVEKIAQLGPSSIIHLAASYPTSESTTEIYRSIQATIGLGTLLIKAAHRTNSSFLTTGSYWQFRGGIPKPTGFYAVAKQAFGEILSYYRNEHDMHATELILYDVYGQQDNRKKIVPLLLESCKSGTYIELRRKDALINLTHVSDIMNGFIQILHERNSPRICALRNEVFISIEELVETVESVTGKRVNHSYSGESTKNLMIQPWIFGEVLPGWSPKIDLEQGIKICWDDMAQSAGRD